MKNFSKYRASDVPSFSASVKVVLSVVEKQVKQLLYKKYVSQATVLGFRVVKCAQQERHGVVVNRGAAYRCIPGPLLTG